MAYWMPSAVQKRLLRYALSRTGLLDDSAIDLADLDITLGRQNVVKLSNVGLDIEHIGKLAQLPPELRIETARVLSLKLTVPADIFTSSIVAEADGVEVSVRLVEDKKRRRRREPGMANQSEHGRAGHQTHSPPHGGARRRSSTPGGDGRLPTTQDLARSFLLEEPLQERRQLEASIAAREPALDESIASGSTESSEVGTGAGVGLPGFLAGFLQGIVDRLQLRIRNAQAKLELDLPGEEPIPLTVRLTIGDAEAETAQVDNTGHRTMRLNEMALDILTDATTISALSEASASLSPKTTRSTTRSVTLDQMQPPKSSSTERPTTASTSNSSRSHVAPRSVEEMRTDPDNLQASIATADSDRFADAGDDEQVLGRSRDSSPDTDILPGEDNESFAARRRQGSAPSDNLWDSVASEEDLPDSLLLETTRIKAQDTASGSRQRDSGTSRSPRAVSPYARNMKSPGSWPRMSPSPSRKLPKQSPGSWPAIDQMQRSTMQPLTPGPSLDREDPMDNKGAALRHVNDSHTAETFENAPETGDPVEDLAKSTYFDHQQAKSMYMSAMTQGQSQTMAVPGGWGSYDSSSERSLSPEISRQPHVCRDSPSLKSPNPANFVAQEQAVAQLNSPLGADLTASGVDTPRAASPTLERPQPLAPPLQERLAKRLVHLDHLSVQIPASTTGHAAQSGLPDVDDQPAATSTRGDIPGAFSVYSERPGTRRGDTSSASSEYGSVHVARQESSTDRENPIRVRLGKVDGFLDLSLGKIIHGFLLQILPLLNKEERETDPSRSQTSNPAATPLIDFAINRLGVHLSHEISASIQPRGQNDTMDHVVSLQCTNIFFNTSADYVKMGIGQLALLVGGHSMLSFNRDHSMQASVAIQPDTPDIELKMSSSILAATGRPSSRILLNVLPIVLDINIPIFEDAFASLGGLSGLLELGNSIVSEGTATSASSKPNKGVRFAEDKPPLSSGPELKVDGRVEGAAITLKTNSCAVVLFTAAIKFVHRPEKTGVVTSLIRLEGPHTRDRSAPPSKIDIENVKLEYVNSAQESDLERLLSLLTPRKDKYDSDDDIMIDTLLRQRRKGAVARLTLDKVRINVADLKSFSLLQELATEMGQISAVAKYLPEDERPGLMTILRINETHGQVPINDRFGNLIIRAGGLTAAHVGLPPLFALAVSGARVTDADENPLVHAVIPLNGAEDSPMVMARMLGNEAEPTVKIKLFNICLEYSVRALLDLTDTDEQLDAEELAAGLAKSVAALAMRAPNSGGSEPGSSPLPDTPSDTSSSTSKRTRANLLLHDCAIGLTPSNPPSKALLVITDARASTLIPPETTLTAQLELRRSGLLLTDDTSSTSHSPSTPSNTSVTPRLLLALWKQGYASVGSITSAKLEARVFAGQNDEKSIELDFTNKLLFLETCADSTQTLIATLNGLAPPPKPSKQPKYLTEPMSIEDMMASFTGEPVEKPERAPSTLFDADDEVDPADVFEADLELGSDQDDDLLIESETTNSLYGPVSGMLTGVDAPVDDDRSAAQFQGETADSLLEEEDPFEMPSSPTDMTLSDHQLMRDLDGQAKQAVVDEPIDLDVLEYDDISREAIGPGQTALGTSYRFAAPGIGGYQPIEPGKQDSLPFKFRLHDCHVIWHIHDGYDWQRTQDGITEAVEQIEMRAEEKKNRRRLSRNDPEDEEDVIGDCLFNSIYIGVPSATGAQDLRRQINRHIDEDMSLTETESVPASGMTAGGRPARRRKQRRLKLGRSPRHKAAFELKGVAADILVFNPDSGQVQSSVDVRLRDFEIFDNVPTSTWRKFLTCAQGKNAREMSKPMVHLQLSNVKTLQDFSATEIVLRVTILPLRLHVDQDALDFITRFFEFKDESAVPPVNTDQLFLQRVEIDTVDLCLDYKPKKVDYAGIRSGHTTEFMNFVILEGCDVRLNHAIIYGIQGFEPLHKTLNDIWMPDVKANQLPKILTGLAPVRNLANLGAGMRDVVAIPVREYRKDGRIVRNIQKGAFRFAKTTTTEMARIGAKVAIGTQNMLSNAEGLLGSSATSPLHRAGDDEDQDAPEQRAISAYADQPLGVLSGLRYARRHLEHDLLTARDALIAVQGEVFESSNPTSAAAAVVRHGPTVILRPIIGASRAVGTAMTGLGNQIDPANVARMEDKYKPRR